MRNFRSFLTCWLSYLKQLLTGNNSATRTLWFWIFSLITDPFFRKSSQSLPLLLIKSVPVSYCLSTKYRSTKTNPFDLKFSDQQNIFFLSTRCSSTCTSSKLVKLEAQIRLIIGQKMLENCSHVWFVCAHVFKTTVGNDAYGLGVDSSLAMIPIKPLINGLKVTTLDHCCTSLDHDQ